MLNPRITFVSIVLVVNLNNASAADNHVSTDQRAKAQSIFNEMTCVIPNDVSKVRPFLSLDWGEVERIQLAVKAIEILRRKDSERNWNHAATSFYMQQMYLERFSGLMNSDREKLGRWIRKPELAQVEIGAPVDVAAEKVGNVYRKSCTDYIKELRSTNKLLGEAQKISDKDLKSKGLMAKPLPCPVIDLPDCKP